MITKLLKKHKSNCSAVKTFKKGTWSTPWFLKEFYYYRKWHRVGRLVCNSTDCKAEMRVDIQELEEQFNKYI